MLVNATPFAARDVAYIDSAGSEVVVAIIKATFELSPSGRVVPASEPAPIRLADVPWYGDVEQSSVRYPSDLADQKVGADVIVVGDAISPRPVEVLDVGIRVADTVVPIRVHGPRVFYSGVLGPTIGDAASFERETLQYEKAYGGTASDYSAVEARNPVGTGLAKSSDELIERSAPRIEHPARPHRSWFDRHAPWGCGAIASHWAPRREHFGTLDDDWQKHRMPLPPLDFDYRYYNVAHPALQLALPIGSGMGVGIIGMHENGALNFELPEFRPIFTGIYGTGSCRKLAEIDTLLLEPNVGRFELVARASFLLGRTNLLRELRIDLERRA
jgi:hypothetical protein